MPWHIDKTESCPASKPWGVIKDSDGKVVGCHETKESAIGQLVVLKEVESGSRPYLENLWEDEMQAVLLAAETSFGEATVVLNSSGKTYRLLLALTAEQRKVGLSFRSSLPDGIDGMLFVYPQEELRTFGAEFTKMDLDLYGFNSEGKLTTHKELPAGSVSSYVVPNAQFVVETTKDIEIEFLELQAWR